MDYFHLRFGVFYIVDNKPVSRDLFNKTSRAIFMLSQLPSLYKLIRWETMYDENADGPMLVTRLINVGNAGRDAVVTMRLPNSQQEWISYHIDSQMRRFVDTVFDVPSLHEGDVTIDDTDDYDFITTLNDSMAEEPTTTYSLSLNIDQPHPSCKKESNINSGCIVEHDEDALFDEDNAEMRRIEAAQHEAFQRLREAIINYVLTYNADPTKLMEKLLKGKFIVDAHGLSPIVINGDAEIVLTGYDELKVKMPAMTRALYILFLNHLKDGIVLKNFSDYSTELEKIYLNAKPNCDRNRLDASINNLCNPFSNTLNEYLSKIKRSFRVVMVDTPTTDRYLIKGLPVQPYRMDLPAEFVTISPAILQ